MCFWNIVNQLYIIYIYIYIHTYIYIYIYIYIYKHWLQSQILWEFLPHCQTTRLGILMEGSEFLFLWKNICGINIFQFVDHSRGGYEIRLYHNFAHPAISLWLLFFFGCKISFLIGSSTFFFFFFEAGVVNGCVVSSWLWFFFF